jgi:hypothetical protein
MGYNSKYFLVNIDMVLFVFLLLVVIVIVLLAIRPLVIRYNKAIFDKVKVKIFFSAILRFPMTSYLKNSLAALIALQAISLTTQAEIIDGIISIITFILLIGFPIFTYKFLKKN